MKDIETWLKSRYSEQLIHENSAFISSIIHDYCTETVKNNAVLPHVSGSLPMWTEIHIQPLDIGDIENSKVYWIKHPQKTWSVYDKDLVTAMKEFVERLGNER